MIQADFTAIHSHQLHVVSTGAPIECLFIVSVLDTDPLIDVGQMGSHGETKRMFGEISDIHHPATDGDDVARLFDHHLEYRIAGCSAAKDHLIDFLAGILPRLQ